jgi:hypothetical protein
MGLTVSDGQVAATQRMDVHGAVYALSGTLPARVTDLPDLELRWATTNVPAANGPLGAGDGKRWEPYIALPGSITRELGFRAGEQQPMHPIQLTVRNHALRHKESVLASVVDEEYAWEGAEASLWVAFLRPGQAVADLVQSDWTALRLRGNFGAPRNIREDGFNVPVNSRDAIRSQTLNLRTATSGDFPNIWPLDDGRVIPVVVGGPNSRVRAIRTDAGLFGFTVGVASGGLASGIEVDANGFFFKQWEDAVNGGAQFFLRASDKLVTFGSAKPGQGSLLGDVEYIPTIQLTLPGGTIDFPVPEGSIIQELKPAGYRFLLANQDLEAGPNPIDEMAPAFEALDGRMVPIPLASMSIDAVADASGIDGFRTELILSSGSPPALQPNALTSGGVAVTDDSVTQQPIFSTTAKERLNNWINRPSGGSGTDNDKARDGSENTGASLAAGGAAINLTFAAPPSMTNPTTNRSVLHIVMQGTLRFFAGASATVLADIGPTSKDTFHITQSVARDADQTVRVLSPAGSGGGILYELWWEHDIEGDIDLDRDQDVEINVEVSSTLDQPLDFEGIAGIAFQPRDLGNVFGGQAANPWKHASGAWELATPAATFADLQRFLVEDGDATYGNYIDAAAYAAAKARYEALGIAGMSFALAKPTTWAKLEASLAQQCRSHAFYGVSGHKLIVMETRDTAEGQAIEQEFRLPGTPNPNAAQSAGSPIMERGGASDVINKMRVYWDRNWLETGSDPGDLYLRRVDAENALSVSKYGERVDGDGALPFWAWSAQELPDSFITPVEDIVSGIAQFYADRFAFGVTRFAFETGPIAFGIDRGSFVRVAFAVFPGIYRNVVCEVESVAQSPINGERAFLVARAVGPPQRGLTFALTWEDLFISDADQWTSRLTGAFDRWQQYWGAP